MKWNGFMEVNRYLAGAAGFLHKLGNEFVHVDRGASIVVANFLMAIKDE